MVDSPTLQSVSVHTQVASRSIQGEHYYSRTTLFIYIRAYVEWKSVITTSPKGLIKSWYLARSCKRPRDKISVRADKVACSQARHRESAAHSVVALSSVGRRASGRRGGTRCDPSPFPRTCRAPCDRSAPSVLRLPRRVHTPPGTSPYRSSRLRTPPLPSATSLSNTSRHSDRAIRLVCERMGRSVEYLA